MDFFIESPKKEIILKCIIINDHFTSKLIIINFIMICRFSRNLTNVIKYFHGSHAEQDLDTAKL